MLVFFSLFFVQVRVFPVWYLVHEILVRLRTKGKHLFSESFTNVVNPTVSTWESGSRELGIWALTRVTLRFVCRRHVSHTMPDLLWYISRFKSPRVAIGSWTQQLLIRKCVKTLFSMLTKKTQMKWRGLFLYLLAFWMAETKKEKRKQSFVLAFYTPTSVCVFCLLWSLHFLWYWQGEFVEKSRASSIGDHFQYSYDLNGWFRSNTVPRN